MNKLTNDENSGNVLSRQQNNTNSQDDLLQVVIDAIDHPFYIIDVNSYAVIMANGTANNARLTEKTTCFAMRHQRDHPCHEDGHPCPLHIIKQTGKPVQVEHVYFDKKGSKRYMKVHGYPIFDKNGKVKQVIEHAFDITEAKKSEQLLQSTLEKYSDLNDEQSFILENMSDFVYRHDVKGIFYYLSPTIERITGYTIKEWLKHYSAYMTDNPINQKVYETTDRAMKTGKKMPPYLVEIYHKEGRRLTLEVNERPFFEDGKVAGIIGVGRDVTTRQREEAERERLTRAIQQKNNELEEIIFATSHDLRSPLLNIQGFTAELCRSCVQLREQISGEILESNPNLKTILEEEIPEASNYILAGVEKMDKLLRAIVRVSRLGRADLSIEQLDMNKMLVDITQTMEFQLQQTGAQVEIDDLPDCYGDAEQMNQVFTNLLDNALKYLDRSRQGLVRVAGEIQGDKTIYRVRDNGIGISEAQKDKIFEMFSRLGNVDVKGEGLGLTISQRIIQRHQGKIQVESTMGRGSEFIVLLPISSLTSCL